MIPSRDDVHQAWRRVGLSLVGLAAPDPAFLRGVAPKSIAAQRVYAIPNMVVKTADGREVRDSNSTCLMVQAWALATLLEGYGFSFSWLDDREDWHVWAPMVELAKRCGAYNIGATPGPASIYHLETKTARHWRGVIGKTANGYQTFDGGAKNAKGYQCVVEASPHVQGLYDLTSQKPIVDWIDVPALVIYLATEAERASKPSTAPPPPAAQTGKRPTLRVGSRGADVQAWQRIVGATADGVFGAGTERLTKAWQAANGLTPDGVVGARSWGAAERKATDPTVRRVTEGVDLSHWNAPSTIRYDDPSWTWAYAKAKQGIGKPDKAFHEHCQRVKNAGKLRGAYDYLEVRAGVGAQDADLSADQFATLYRMAGCELPPAVDLELDGNKGRTDDEVLAAVLMWGRTIKRLIPEHRPLLYTFVSFVTELHKGLKVAHELADVFDLWIAHHGVTNPTTPPPWEEWSVHQYVGQVLDRNRSRIF